MKDIEVTLTGEHAPDDNSKMTGVDGSYSFDELRKGDYTVTMTNPDGNAYSFPTVATPVNLGVGQEQPGISFAGTRLKRASISGQVYAAGDPVANVTVTLSGDATGEDMTDANGEYNFPGLAIGSYTVTISGWAEAAYIFNAPASDAEIVNNDDFLIVDFEGEHTMTASIGGMLFIDEGGQTALARDAGEPVLDLTGVLPEGMTGLPLTLLGPELTSPPTAGFASREGMYEFPGLQAGTYVINVDEATVEDMLAGLGYEYTGPSLILVSVAAAEEKTDVNLPFKITLQTINVGAVMGTPDAATATLVGGVELALYPTLEAAEAGTPILGTATTDSTTGAAEFEFPRAMDLGPGGTGNDRLVFAKVMDEGHADLEFSDNKEIEIQYAATDRVSNALAAARLVNVQVNFQWWVKSNETAKDGNEFLGGWVANNGMETDATGLAMFSERLEEPDWIAGKTYEVMLNEEQDDRVSGEEMWVPSDTLEHTHNPLLLPDAEIPNDLGPIYVTWTTQSLTLGVYREADDVEGYTNYRSALPSGDVRPDSAVGKAMTVELLARESGTNRLRRHKWDGNEGYASFDANGMVTFTGIDADVELTVRYRPGNDRIQMDYGYDEIETFGADLDRGVTLGAFGGMSGGQPEVRMCSASDDTNADATSDEWCATFAYQWNTGTVYGTVGLESGHEVDVDPETGHGAIGGEDETVAGGAYSIGDLQDGVYTATAASGDPNYPLLDPAEVEGIALYHNEECWAATNPEPATGVRPSSCALDEVDVEDDDGTTTYTYVNRHEESWLAGNQPPEVTAAIADLAIEVGASIGLDFLDNFTDPEGDDLTFTATSDAVAVASAGVDGSESEFTITGVAVGTATITVTASDGTLTAQDTFVVTVAAPPNQAPEVTAPVPDLAIEVGDSIELDFLYNFTDPDDDDVLTFTATSDDVAVASADPDPDGSESEFEILGLEVGTATITVTASDGTLTAQDTFVVTVAAPPNQAPEVTAPVPDLAIEVGDSIELDFLYNFTDPDDDDVLTFTATSDDVAVASADPDPDGSESEFEILGLEVGTATITVTASDGTLTAQDTFVVTVAAPPNQAPEVTDSIDDQDIEVGDRLELDFLDNFTDPEGDDLTFTTTSDDVEVAWVGVDPDASESEFEILGQAVGTATITVTATDVDGAFVTDDFEVRVTAANQAPELTDSIPDLDIDVGDSIGLDFSLNFTDPEGDDLTFTATSDDGAVASADPDGSESEFTIAGVAVGTATITVTATDVDGAMTTDDFEVRVTAANQAPELTDSIPDLDIDVGDSIGLDFSLNFTDPEGDDLTFTATSDDGAVASADPDGSESEFTIAGVAVGTATITVTATDVDGAMTTDDFEVRVTAANQAPELTDSIPDLDIDVGDSIGLDFSLNFTDPEGDDLTFTATSDDGAVASADPDGSESEFTIAGVAVGTATITVTATDVDGAMTTDDFEVRVTAANQAPELTDSIPDLDIDVGDSIGLDFSLNFTDPEGDDLTFTATSDDGAVASADPDGSESEFTIAGVAVGTATITVTATDVDGAMTTDDFEVRVTAANQAPELTDSIPDLDIEVGDSIGLDFSLNFTDPEGDDLTFTAESDAVAVASADPDPDGSESIFTIAGVAVGTATITVTATDVDGAMTTDDFEVRVTAANQAPELTAPIGDQDIEVGDSIGLDFSLNFTDPEGDDLTFTAESDDGAVASADPDGSESEFTIAGVAVGTATITVTATDVDGAMTTDDFEVRVTAANQAPELTDSIPDLDIEVGDSIDLDLSLNFIDPEGDDLTFTAESDADEDAPAPFTVTITGSILTIIGVAAGTADITVTATDTDDAFVTDKFEVRVTAANQAPELTAPIGDQDIEVGDSIDLDLSLNFIDPEGDDLTFTAESDADEDAPAPFTVTITGSILTIIGVAAGTADITVTATDTDDAFVTDDFEVLVTAANLAPELTDSIPDLDIEVGDSIDLDLSLNFIDPEGDDLTFTAESDADEDAPAPFTVTITGSILTIIGVAAGTADITVTATDTDDAFVTDDFEVLVTAANLAPELTTDIADQDIEVGDSIDLDLSLNFIDPEGDDLTFTAESDADEDAPAPFTVTITGSILTIIGVAAGTADITVTATDTDDAFVTDDFEVLVTAANLAPELTDSIPDLDIDVGDSIGLDFSYNFTDPEGDDLTFTAESDAVAVASADPDPDGSESIFTIAGVAVGTATITVTATDVDGAMTTDDFEVRVTAANQAPELTDSIPDLDIEVGDSIDLDLSLNFIDPEGDDLTFTAESDADEDAPAPFTVTITGSILTIIGVAAGTADITVTATDTDDAFVTDKFEVRVTAANQAPELTAPIGDQDIEVGDSIDLDLSLNFIDPEGDDLTFTAESDADEDAPAPFTVTITGSILTIIGVAAGTADITVTATDTDDAFVTDDFEVLVTAANLAPELTDSIPDLDIDVGDSIGLDFSYNFTDPEGDDLTFTAESDAVAVASADPDPDGSESIFTIAGVAVGTATITVTATDVDGAMTTDDFEVLVTAANLAPELTTDIADQDIEVGDTIDLDLSLNFIDPEGDDLTFTAESDADEDAPAPFTVTITGSILTIIGVAAGTADITVTATDTDDAFVTDKFEVLVPESD